jgi:hypothetical protein
MVGAAMPMAALAAGAGITKGAVMVAAVAVGTIREPVMTAAGVEDVGVTRGAVTAVAVAEDVATKAAVGTKEMAMAAEAVVAISRAATTTAAAVVGITRAATTTVAAVVDMKEVAMLDAAAEAEVVAGTSRAATTTAAAVVAIRAAAAGEEEARTSPSRICTKPRGLLYRIATPRRRPSSGSSSRGWRSAVRSRRSRRAPDLAPPVGRAC